MSGLEFWSLPHPPEEGITMLGQVTQSHLLKWPINDIDEVPHAYANFRGVVPDIPHSGEKNAHDSCRPSAHKPPMHVVIHKGRKKNMYKPGELLLPDSLD